MASMLELIYEDADGNHRVPIRGTLTFGRSSDNDVVLRDFSISRHHARIDVEDGVARINDLDSTNGVKINETMVASGPLAPGDRLVIGSFTLLVQDAEDSTSGLSSATSIRTTGWKVALRHHPRRMSSVGSESSRF
jgi:adenylate cyclase